MSAKIVMCKDCKHRPINLFILKDKPRARNELYFPDKVCPLQCLYDNSYNEWEGNDFFCAHGESDKPHFCKECKYFHTEHYNNLSFTDDYRYDTKNFCYAEREKEQVHPFENACSSFKEKEEV